MNATILLITTTPPETATATGYVTGVVIALLILVYLLYSLAKPENF